jgi:uncharacterized protein (TIGR03437 family)
MGSFPARRLYPLISLLFLVLCAGRLEAQKAQDLVTLSGHIHAGVRAENDRGHVDASLQLPYVLLILKPTAAQQRDLDNFLVAVQVPGSPDYHRWLTPEQYGARFGVAQADIDKITAWLGSRNLTVISVARGRNSIAFSGNVRAVEGAFHTEIHQYLVKGENHYANASNPSVPAEFGDVIGAIHGLNDFRMKAPRHTLKKLPNADYTNVNLCGNYCFAPDDLATEYDITPLFSSGINGAGQKVAIAGQTDINLSDIQQFRSFFSLPANVPQTVLVPGSQDPGLQIQSGDLSEADLDLEWAGAVARDATILYYYSEDVFVSANYIIDQNAAPVLSMSYGDCEQDTGNAELTTLQGMAEQANAEGMTWINASGDDGGVDCYGDEPNVVYGLGVDAPASVPGVTGAGGTELNEGNGTYWSATNTATNASLERYVPETTWNDSGEDGSPSASGGGASEFFAKPSWQTGPGVPSDGSRDVPDISLSASADHDGFLVYTEDTGGYCGGVPSCFQVFGGTSVATPSFAGMVILINQYLVSNGLQSSAGLGNVNPRLYQLAQSSPSAFHDITTGNNAVDPCPSRARSCNSTPLGYNAGPGYDLATGLGSVDAYSLATSWSTASVTGPTTSISLTASPQTIAQSSGSTILTATVTSSSGSAPTGVVTFSSQGATLGSANLVASTGLSSTATLTVAGSQLTAGSVAITANYGNVSASVTITVTSAGGALTIQGMTNAASYQAIFSPGAIVAIFGTQLATSTVSAGSVPLPTQLGGASVSVNGIPAPLYYASPGQLNVQIPYSVVANSIATLQVNSNGQSASTQFGIEGAAPGIFADSTGALVGYPTATPGQTIALYFTGGGADSPAAVTGSTPAPNTVPKPVQPVSISVGGVAVTTPFTYLGTPSWAIGITQVNFTVPANVAAGVQRVVVTVGGIPSAAANLTIAQ